MLLEPHTQPPFALPADSNFQATGNAHCLEIHNALCISDAATLHCHVWAMHEADSRVQDLYTLFLDK